MPAFIKTKIDERYWQRAKEHYKQGRSVPRDERQWASRDWATVTNIFKAICAKHGGCSRQNPPAEWAKTTAYWLRESEYYKLPWIKKFVRQLEAATTDAQYRSLKAELERFLEQLETGPGTEGAGPSVEDINAALLTSTLGLGESGLATPGVRGPVRGQTPHAPRPRHTPTAAPRARGQTQHAPHAPHAPRHPTRPGQTREFRRRQDIWRETALEGGQVRIERIRRATPEEQALIPEEHTLAPHGLEEAGLRVILHTNDDGDVLVTCWDAEGARNDQSIQGSRWEFDGDLAYTVITNTPDLANELRAEGYIVDASEWTPPETPTTTQLIQHATRTIAGQAPNINVMRFAEGYIQATIDAARHGEAFNEDDLTNHTQEVMLHTCEHFCDKNAAEVDALYREGFTYAEIGEGFYLARNRQLPRVAHNRARSTNADFLRVAHYWSDYILTYDADNKLIGLSNLAWFQTAADGEVNDPEARKFIRGFFEVALIDAIEGNFPLGMDYTHFACDLASVAVERGADLCLKFLSWNVDDLRVFREVDGLTYEECGRLFYWNMNGHGRGFWENDPHRDPAHDAVAGRLNQSAHGFSPFSLYRGDDQLIWYTNG